MVFFEFQYTYTYICDGEVRDSMAIQVKKGVALVEWRNVYFEVNWLSLVVFIFGFSVKTQNISEHFYSAGSHCT